MVKLVERKNIPYRENKRKKLFEEFEENCKEVGLYVKSLPTMDIYGKRYEDHYGIIGKTPGGFLFISANGFFTLNENEYRFSYRQLINRLNKIMANDVRFEKPNKEDEGVIVNRLNKVFGYNYSHKFSGLKTRVPAQMPPYRSLLLHPPPQTIHHQPELYRPHAGYPG